MGTGQHRALHEVGLKQVVSRCAVEEVARWLERVDPPRSEVANTSPFRGQLDRLAPASGRRLAGVAAGHAAVANRVWLVQPLA